jgi:hypothetical protein
MMGDCGITSSGSECGLVTNCQKRETQSFVGEVEAKRPLGKPNRKWTNIIKIS